MLRTRGFAAGAVAVAVGLVLAAVALGGDGVPKIRSQVKINFASGGTYRGVVKSKLPECVRARQVKVYHESTPLFLIGTAMTNSNGKWHLTGPEPPVGQQVYPVVTRDTYARGKFRDDGICGQQIGPHVVYPKGG